MNCKIVISVLALAAILLGQNIFAMDFVQDEEVAEESKTLSGLTSIKNIYLSGNSIINSYIPSRLNCGTFVGFKDTQTIDIDKRSYTFCGGATISPMGRETLTINAIDILPIGSFDRELPMEDILLNMKNGSLVMVFKYKDDSYLNLGYSYRFNVETFMGSDDFQAFQIQLIYNKYIPNESTRNAFQCLKDGKVSEIEGKNYIFVKGKEIYKDYEVEKQSVIDVLPGNLLLNSWRSNHKLVGIKPELLAQKEKGILSLSYRYEPSMWYRGEATHFEFTVATILEPEDASALNDLTFLKVSIANDMANDLYGDIIEAYNQNLLSDENFNTFFFGTNAARIYVIERIRKGDLTQKDMERQFKFWRSRLNMATSPVTLYFETGANINIFELMKSNPALNVVTDSIINFTFPAVVQ